MHVAWWRRIRREAELQQQLDELMRDHKRLIWGIRNELNDPEAGLLIKLDRVQLRVDFAAQRQRWRNRFQSCD